MRTKLSVFLGTDFITVDVLQPRNEGGRRSVGKRFLAYLQGDKGANYQIHKSIRLQGSTGHQGLALLFAKALEALKAEQHLVLETSELELILGASHARVGLLEIQSDATSQLSQEDRRLHVNAWVSQVWGMDPLDCVVRSLLIDDGDKTLVTCIESHVVDSVTVLCAQEGIRFTSCMPALVAYITESPTRAAAGERGAGAEVLVATERCFDGQRASVVQFVVLDQNLPLSVTRMWLPPSTQQAGEAELQGVVERLRLQHPQIGNPEVRVVAFPKLANSGSASSQERT